MAPRHDRPRQEYVVLKLVTFVRRAPGLAPEAFGGTWRELALRWHEDTPSEFRPRRVEHCVVREGRRRPAWDGLALAWFDDPAGSDAWRGRWTATGTGSRGIADVLDASRTEAVLVEERQVFGQGWLKARREAEARSPALLLIGLIQRCPELDRAAFRDYWWNRHRPLANALIPPQLQPAAYVHDYVLPAEPTRWDGIGEMYEESMDRARERGRWFETETAAALAADEQRFMLRSSRTVLVTEHEIVI